MNLYVFLGDLSSDNNVKGSGQMIFVKISDLKNGMRLARPIYAKTGVLLYERNSKLTSQAIESIKSFGLIGMFILEPAEPVPPMTQADMDFERFQTMNTFSIKEELEKIKKTGHPSKIQIIVSNIIKVYGHLDKKINFVQNLRSKEDYIYKHALNVSILCTLMASYMNVKVSDQNECVTAAIIHDIGMLLVPQELLDKEDKDDDDIRTITAARTKGYDIIESAFSSHPNVKRICLQTASKADSRENVKMVDGAKILAVADTFDSMTAMQLDKPPASEVAAIKYLIENPEKFDKESVDALTRTINILSPGVSVELNTGDKALILAENQENILKPMLLNFRNNTIMDLSNEIDYGDVSIVDAMKTMDNRCIMDTKTLAKYGVKVDDQDYVDVPGDQQNS
jgi:HD-GYP domain-containing protein (c-di-GMP phosphodiesterase class II)